jgi:hypothetical protein
MAGSLKTALKETGAYLFMAFKALLFWRREPPVINVAQLVKYIETRSKFVAQTTLFGYVKTRAGTRYVSLYEDPLFNESVNIAKWEIYLVCLSDLTTWATASLGRKAMARPGELEALAIHIVDSVVMAEEIPAERPQGFDDIREAYAKRARATAWNQIELGEGPFANSLAALVEWAPIADELKLFDVKIVKNSMRHKWKTVRDQLNELLDAESVLTDWRSMHGEGPGTGEG